MPTLKSRLAQSASKSDSFSALIVGDWAVNERCPEVRISDSKAFFFNLEGAYCPDGEPSEPTEKIGPRVWNSFLPPVKNLIFANLANNHVMDYGEGGARETVARLSEQGIHQGGLSEAPWSGPVPYRLEIKGTKWSIVSVSDPQFGMASSEKFGVNPLDPSIYHSIRQSAKVSDVVCVSVHSGQEQSTIPSPSRLALFRSFIDAGAHMVWGHHSHVAQVFEEYKDGVIFYGLGNFGVNPEEWASDSRYLWSLGMGVNVADRSIEVAPVIFQINTSPSYVIEQLSKEEAERRLAPLESLSQLLRNPVAHENAWRLVAWNLYRQYVEGSMGWGKNVWYRIKLRAADLASRLSLHRPADYLRKHRFHIIANAAHREVLETALITSGSFLSGKETVSSNQLVRDLIAK